MTDQTQDPNVSLPEQKKFNVLMMTAAVISCDASSEIEAAQRALIEGPGILDPKQLQWFVRFVSDKPINLGEPDEEAQIDADAQAEAEHPKLEIVK